MDLKFAVGLIIFTCTQAGKLAAVLQRRGPHDYEKDEPQSFAGAYQISCHGGIEKPSEALQRECHEELGEEFSALLPQNDLLVIGASDSALALQLIGKNFVIYYAFFLTDPSLLEKIKLQPSADKLLLITEDELPSIQTLERSERGGVTGDAVKMFPDAIEALRLGFAKMHELGH